jgi:hypothetical protein
LPRAVYWGLGGAIACGGAIAARVVAEQVPEDYRVIVWLVGSAFIFLGAAVLSLGTRARLDHDDHAEKMK